MHFLHYYKFFLLKLISCKFFLLYSKEFVYMYLPFKKNNFILGKYETYNLFNTKQI